MKLDMKVLMGAKVDQLTLSPSVQTCTEDMTVLQVVEILKANRIGAIVIVEGAKPTGIFTERDYLMKIAATDTDISSTPVKQFMTPNPVCIDASDTVGKILIKMRMGKFRHIIVVDDKGDLQSVISIKDIMDYILNSPFTAQAVAA